MRIVSWNCAMGYARKRRLVEALQPDVAVLQEVSQRHIAETDALFKAWVGSNPHKGLGVIGFTDRSYLLQEAGRLLPWHIPFTVDGVNIVAIWAHVRDKDLKYVRVIHEIVDRHADFLTSAPSLLIGDFNSNTIWDREHPGRNHSLLVDKLHGLGLQSVHHQTEGISHGAESTKTYYHTKKLHFGHHIDYAFLRGASACLEIGRHEEWLQYSDHMPLILDIEPLCGAEFLPGPSGSERSFSVPGLTHSLLRSADSAFSNCPFKCGGSRAMIVDMGPCVTDRRGPCSRL